MAGPQRKWLGEFHRRAKLRLLAGDGQVFRVPWRQFAICGALRCLPDPSQREDRRNSVGTHESVAVGQPLVVDSVPVPFDLTMSERVVKAFTAGLHAGAGRPSQPPVGSAAARPPGGPASRQLAWAETHGWRVAEPASWWRSLARRGRAARLEAGGESLGRRSGKRRGEPRFEFS